MLTENCGREIVPLGSLFLEKRETNRSRRRLERNEAFRMPAVSAEDMRHQNTFCVHRNETCVILNSVLSRMLVRRYSSDLQPNSVSWRESLLLVVGCVYR